MVSMVLLVLIIAFNTDFIELENREQVIILLVSKKNFHLKMFFF